MNAKRKTESVTRNTTAHKVDRFGRCPCSGKNLPKLVQPAILRALSDGPLHGYALKERIAALYTAGMNAPTAAGVYRILQRMESCGYLVSHLEQTKTGPARRVYAITTDGRACLARWLQSLTQYRRALDSLLDR